MLASMKGHSKVVMTLISRGAVVDHQAKVAIHCTVCFSLVTRRSGEGRRKRTPGAHCLRMRLIKSPFCDDDVFAWVGFCS